jgi:hypothetical protein
MNRLNVIYKIWCSWYGLPSFLFNSVRWINDMPDTRAGAVGSDTKYVIVNFWTILGTHSVFGDCAAFNTKEPVIHISFSVSTQNRMCYHFWYVKASFLTSMCHVRWLFIVGLLRGLVLISLEFGKCWDSWTPKEIWLPLPILFNHLTPELNPSTQRCLTRFFTGVLLVEPCISLINAWKTNKYTNYSFSLLIMYGSW